MARQVNVLRWHGSRSGAGRCRIMTGHETSVSKRLRGRDPLALINPVQGTVSWLCVVAVAR
jgi:hypothetical protein